VRSIHRADGAYVRAQAIRSVHGQVLQEQVLQEQVLQEQVLQEQVLQEQVLQENAAMLDVCRNPGFQVKPGPQDSSLVVVTLSL
jgi:hypothetical protein